MKQQLGDNSSGHDWWHIYRVTQLAKRIAVEENADSFVCELAALLHDIADEKLNDSKEAGLAKVTHWLKVNDVNQSVSTHVIEIISTLSFSGGKNRPMTSLEGKVVQDADRLDALGAIGMARTFAYSGWKGQLIFDPEIQPREQFTATQYRNEKSTAINHFHEKLFKLKELMNTKVAKEIARERHQFMARFLEQFHGEWNQRL